MGAAWIANAQERVNVSDLPAPVQQTLERWRHEGPVKQVTRHTVDGRQIYDVEIEKNNALNPRFRIAEDGTLLRDAGAALAGPDGVAPIITDEYGALAAPLMPRLKLTDLPAAVQATAKTEAKGREIVDIDRENWRGQPVYEIEFKERGLNSRVYIGDDGQVVRDERRGGQALRSLFLGTQLEDTPPAVQETVRRIAGSREIADIDKKTVNGQTVYRVEIRGPQGVQELRVGADGKVIYDSRATSSQRG